MLERKTTHADDAIARLAQQFKGKAKLEGLVRVLMGFVQELEDVFDDVYVKLARPNAEGAQLDLIGRVVGQPRGTRTDPEYGEAIDARILLNTSHGTIEDLIRMTRTLVGPLNVKVSECDIAGFELVVTESITPIPASWTPSTPVLTGETFTNYGNAYVAMSDGTTAASGGPSGRGAGIVDGSVTWNYYQPGFGELTALFVLSGKPAGVRGIFWYHDTKFPFGFFGDPAAFGFGTGALAGAVELM